MKRLSVITATAILFALLLMLIVWIVTGIGAGRMPIGSIALVAIVLALMLVLVAFVMYATRDHAARERLLSDSLHHRAAARRVCLACGRSLADLPLRGRCPTCSLRYNHEVWETCLHCGYSLRGLARAGRCPECGTGYDLDDRRRLIGLVPLDDAQDPGERERRS